MPLQSVRILALVAMLGGAAYVLSGVLQLVGPEQTDPFSRASDYLAQLLLALAFLLTLAGFVALNLLFRAGGYRGLRGWTGFRAAALGQGAMFASAVASLVTGGLVLGFLYTVGVLVLLVGLALLPVATYKAGAFPWWSAILVAALAAIIFGEIGAVLVGLVWTALGYLLWSQSGATAERLPRVR